jgi:hypothetical protein
MVANSAIWMIADLAAMPNDDGWKRYSFLCLTFDVQKGSPPSPKKYRSHLPSGIL